MPRKDAAPQPDTDLLAPAPADNFTTDTAPAAPPTTDLTTEEAPPVSGLVLVDVPAHGLACGSYHTLPADLAAALARDGAFDPAAPAPL